MGTNFLKIIIILFVYSIVVSATCRKRLSCREVSFSFVTTMKAFPDADSININDTIWLEFESPTSLVDNISGNLVNYSGAVNFGTDVSFDQFVGGSFSNPGTMPAVNAFEYKLIEGVFLPDDVMPDRNKDYNFIEIGNMYRFKLGVIPKRVGIYSIAIDNAANVYRRSDECTKANFQITFANTDQHLYFYEQNRPGYTPSVYEQTHMYCFKVK